MKDRILQLIHERDKKLISKYCNEGAYLDENGNAVHGICRNVELQDLLNDLHLSDALMVREIYEETE